MKCKERGKYCFIPPGFGAKPRENAFKHKRDTLGRFQDTAGCTLNENCYAKKCHSFSENIRKFNKCLTIYGNTTYENWDILEYSPIFYADISLPTDKQ